MMGMRWMDEREEEDELVTIEVVNKLFGNCYNITKQ